MKMKLVKNSKTNKQKKTLKKKTKVGELALLTSRFIIVSKTGKYQCKNRGLQSPETDPCALGH